MPIVTLDRDNRYVPFIRDALPWEVDENGKILDRFAVYIPQDRLDWVNSVEREYDKVIQYLDSLKD